MRYLTGQGLDDGVRAAVLAAMAMVLVACGGSSISASTPTSALLRINNLPSGWIVDQALLVDSSPPCVKAAKSPLEGQAWAEAAFAGEEDHLGSRATSSQPPSPILRSRAPLRSL